MSSRCFIVAAVLANLAIMAAPAAQAIDRIPDRDLRSYCQQYLTRPASPSATVCVAYVQGFLDSLQSLEASPLKLDNDDNPMRRDTPVQREQVDAVSDERETTAENGADGNAGARTDTGAMENTGYQQASVTDEANAENPPGNETPAKMSPVAEKRHQRNEAQTRMEALVAEYGPPARAGVCLPEGLGMERAARIIARGIVYQRAGYDESVGDQATLALRTTYPCDPDE